MPEEPNYWSVKAGEKGNEEEYWDEFISNGWVAIGWSYIGDLSDNPTKDEIKRRITEAGGEGNKGQLGQSARHINDFLEIKEGDGVIAYAGGLSIFGVGRVTGGYKYEDRGDIQYQHTKPVDWLVSSTSRISIRDIKDKLKREAIYKPGTVHKLEPEDWELIYNFAKKTPITDLKVHVNIDCSYKIFDSNDNITSIEFEIEGGEKREFEEIPLEKDNSPDIIPNVKIGGDGEYSLVFSDVKGYLTPKTKKFRIENGYVYPNLIKGDYISKGGDIDLYYKLFSQALEELGSNNKLKISTILEKMSDLVANQGGTLPDGWEEEAKKVIRNNAIPIG
ncbi:MAG: hypothetical protein V3T58_05370 [Candidatus Hydrothermarchaeales archaeon]